jgi:hypothetical protein
MKNWYFLMSRTVDLRYCKNCVAAEEQCLSYKSYMWDLVLLRRISERFHALILNMYYFEWLIHNVNKNEIYTT